MPSTGVIVRRRFEPDHEAELRALCLLLRASRGGKPQEKGTARVEAEQ
jgi:hypothetical protein